ncbi:MAG: 2-dehydropantoate 2-reductase [Candidatus Omnitrophica bacterium]|nr:2-dehydropantoate 2-reductase [Candidatus Omnitrophota bacterium]
MKIVIVGPGALGCLLAALLSKTRQEIWLFDKDPGRAARIDKSGITVEGISAKMRSPVRAAAESKEIGCADLVIIAVKSYDTKAAIINARPLIGNNTKVLTLQNGIGNLETITEIVGSDIVIGGTTNLGATLLEEAKVRYAGKGETVIGRPDGKIPVEMRWIRETFDKAGLEIRFSRDIKGLLWSKLILNAGINALTAITQLKNGRLIEIEGARRILRGAVTEATRIAKRKKIKLIYDDPLAKAEAVCEATANNISSMLQDVLKHKRTEIDFINGVIVRFGQELNLAVPYNSMLLDLVKSIEAGYA